MTVELPPIVEAERLIIRPGDALAIHIESRTISRSDAETLTDIVRAGLGMPDLPILILCQGYAVTIVEPARHPAVRCCDRHAIYGLDGSPCAGPFETGTI